MRILQLGKFYPIKGGVEKVMFDLTEGLVGSNIECDMLCTNSEESKLINLKRNNHIYCCYAPIKYAATTFSSSLIVKLRQICKDYDIIHVHHPDPMAALALFFSGYQGKVVLHWHSDIIKQKNLIKVYKPLQDWLINRASRIIGTTPVYVKESPFLAKAQGKVDYLPIGIEQIIPDEKRVKEITDSYKDKKIIFSVGRLVEYKGYEYLIDSAKFLSEDYVIIIAGSGPLKEKLEKQIIAHSLQDKVKLIGYIDDKEKYAYYGACKLFCMSSIMKTEAFGIVQIEAMSCRKPVVATNIDASGVSWVNAHGLSGLNVEIKNAQKLAEAFVSICDEDTKYNKYCNQAYARYKLMFQKEDMLRKCVSLYDEILLDNETQQFEIYQTNLSQEAI